ncbi:MAG: heparinase II/III-family protein, partial [Armatimonadota bacterium]|nr:heparinase II/III-family protein [Armatimonadota bacterium]
ATTAALAVGPAVLRAADAKTAEGAKSAEGAADNVLASLRREHPRLLASAASWEKIQTRQREDQLLAGFLRRGEAEARAILTMPPVTYQKKGRRLLHVSRTVLRRVLLLGLHFHLTRDAALAQRAREEMLAVAAFSDWNPSHFLDVGEMTAALAFGYDWLYDQLDAPSRQVIATAIVEKGLRPGLTDNGWTRSENNWNSVCLGGLSLGALAIAEEQPVLAAQILNMTRTYNRNGLKPYAPDGVYIEGAMYWGYGTTFQVVLLAALQSALGTDWGLSQSPGFLQSADALLQQLGPSGSFFNFFDGVERPSLEGATWWFAHTLKRPELLRYDLPRIKSYAAATQPPDPQTEAERLLPLAALWWPDAPLSDVETSLPLNWYGRSPNPLAAFRSSWNDPKAMYLALKGGKATLSHGHMDAGSFVFEVNGVRWARDLGMQDYYSLESKGVNMWNSAQNGERWKVFRLNNFSHSTLTINNQLHRADGHAAITHFSAGDDPGAIVDLSAVFQEQATKVRRGFVFRLGSHVLMRDEIEGLKAGDTVRWAMLTKAEVSIPDASNGAEAMLREGGQELRVRHQSSVNSKFEVIAADPPDNGYDAPNPGARLLIVNLTAPESGRLNISVTLQPISQPEVAPVVEEKLAQTELSGWPLASTK